MEIENSPMALRSVDSIGILFSFFDIVDIKALKYILNEMPKDWDKDFGECLWRYLCRIMWMRSRAIDGVITLTHNGKTLALKRKKETVISFVLTHNEEKITWENSYE